MNTVRKTRKLNRARKAYLTARQPIVTMSRQHVSSWHKLSKNTTNEDRKSTTHELLAEAQRSFGSVISREEKIEIAFNMFRKPKKTIKKTAMRRRKDDPEETEGPTRKRRAQDDSDDEDEEEGDTSALLSEAKKRTKQITGKAAPVVANGTSGAKDKTVMHQYTADDSDTIRRKQDLVTSTVEIHSEKQQDQHQSGPAERGEDGIFRDKSRSKLLAGPIKATAHIRTTCRFDYQPGTNRKYFGADEFRIFVSEVSSSHFLL